jgi:iron(III) transport system permease protein
MVRRRLSPVLPVLLACLAVGVLVAMLWVDPRVGRLWANTAILVGGVLLLALPLGVFLASAIVKTDLPGRRAAGLLLAVMVFVPLYLVAGAWDAGFGIQGWHTLATNPHLAHQPWLAGWRAAVWVHALAAVPWVVVIVGAGFYAVEAEVEEDAATCAPAHRVLTHVTLRRAGAAIVVAGLWTAVVASGEISVTDLFQVRTFAEEVYTQAALGAFDLADPVRADERPSGDAAVPLSAGGLWLGLALSVLLASMVLVAGRRLIAELSDVPHRARWIWRFRGARWPMAVAMWLGVVLVAGVPLGNLVYKAGVRVTTTDSGRVRSWSAAKVAGRVAAAPGEYAPELWHSATLGAAAATAALVIGVPLAWSLREARRVPWGRLAALALCLAVPGPLLAIGLIRLLNRPADSLFVLPAWLYDSDFAPWLVQTIRALPLVTLVLWAALATIPQVMLDAAKADRAGPLRRWVSIALPQRWPAVAAAWLIGLAVAVGELAATVLVVPPGPTTISVRIFSLLHYGVEDRVASICLVLVLGLVVVAVVVMTLVARSLRAGR